MNIFFDLVPCEEDSVFTTEPTQVIEHGHFISPTSSFNSPTSPFIFPTVFAICRIASLDLMMSKRTEVQRSQ